MLAAWSASPSRFREDANAEEDLVLGGYRDRVVVELAQNAADAAARAGLPGRLRLLLETGPDGATLRAANTGAPLDAAGVESLSTLRASAKRDDATSVGRFGVGFAAVLAVSDAPSIASRTGAVRWSRADAVSAVTAIPTLAEELARRGEAVPVLRLPFAAPSRPVPDGFDTEVTLPLRSPAAVHLVRELLGSVDAALLLALPALAEVVVAVDGEERKLTSESDGDLLIVGGTRWHVLRESGELDPALLADRPVEERGQREWSVTWAVPVSMSGEPVPLPSSVPAVVHAPTPTDEPLDLPALLIASLPLDPSRRRVAPGPLRDAVVAAAAAAYAALLRDLPATPALLPLLPAGLATGELDALLRGALSAVLPATAFLPAADDSIGDLRLRPREAIVLDDDELVPVLAPVLPGLVPPGWRAGALYALGATRWSASDVVAAVSGLEREPGWWRDLYAALADAGVDRDALAGLPVPLASGGLAGSPRGVVLAGVLDVDLAALGLRSAHPDAAHPLLLRCGAIEADPHALLADARVQGAVADSFEADDPAPVADAALGLVAAAGVSPGTLAWLADLALPAEDGDVYPAGELLLPDSPLRPLVADDAPFGVVAAEVVERWGAHVLEAAGVLRTFAVVRADDVVAAELDLDGEHEYLDFVASVANGAADGEPVVVGDFAAVRDLEFVRDDAWPGALALLAQAPLREVVLAPAVATCGSRRARVPSYTSWWLRRRGVVGGVLPDAAAVLRGLYEPVTLDLDAEFLGAVGALRSLEDADPDDVVARLADPNVVVTREQVRELYSWAEPVMPPSRVRAVRDGELIVVDAADAVVVDAPDLLPLLGTRAVVPAPLASADRVADALDIPMASELAAFGVVSTGRPDGDHVVHDALEVADADGRAVRVAWRLVDGDVHVDAARLAFGLGRGRAWRDHAWERRHLLTEQLRDDTDLAELAAEADLD